MLDPIIGEHPTLRHVRLQLPKLAASSETLVIVGEQGTGKTLLAQHIHSQSPFASRQLQTVDLQLLEDRYQRIFLFGAVPPALTTSRRSPLEVTTTVVIKNPDTAYDYLQEKIAHTFLTQQIQRTDANQRLPVQARTIILLTRHPAELRKTGKLNPRLFSFLSGCTTLSIPPLRKRLGDIPLLTRYFIHQEVARRKRCTILGTNADYKPNRSLLRLLRQQNWGDNIIGLKSFIHSLVVTSPEELIRERERLFLSQTLLMIDEGKEISLKQRTNGIKRMVVTRALQKCNGNEVTTARKLGITNVTVRHIMSDIE